MLFLSRDAGVTILMKLIQIAGKSQGSTQAGPSELSHEDIGALFGVSRTHVRKILQDAAKQGLIALSGRGHRLFEITPVMWQAFDRFVAESMSGHDSDVRDRDAANEDGRRRCRLMRTAVAHAGISGPRTNRSSRHE